MMRAKSMVLITIALGCGLVASIGISQVIKSDGSSKVETADIFVALTDLDINQKLNAENVKLESWPKDRIPEGALTNFKDLEKKFVAVRLYKGEPILMRKVADERFTSAMTIPDGYRVCSAKVTMESSVSNLIRPGDHVDLLAFLRRSGDIPKTMMRTILSDVRLFAINSETEIATDEAGKKIAAKTVSVLVTEEQVPVLMLALELGDLRLSLRHPDEKDDDNSAPVEVTVDVLLGDKSGSGNIADTQSSESSDSGFINFITDQSQRTPVFSTSFNMQVITPNGVDEYKWDDASALPRKASFAGGPVFGPNTGNGGTNDAGQTSTSEEETGAEEEEADAQGDLTPGS